jgi:hypothetical protein
LAKADDSEGHPGWAAPPKDREDEGLRDPNLASAQFAVIGDGPFKEHCVHI